MSEREVNEVNPNHPVTQAVHDHWHKIAALLVQKLGGSALITSDDVLALGVDKAVTVQELSDGLHVRIISLSEGEKLAKIHGGLPE
jgi:hypothetical protein